MRDVELYPAVMKGFVLPAIARFSNFKIWDEYKKGMGLEKLGLDELRDYQMERLRETISHAYNRVPFYVGRCFLEDHGCGRKSFRLQVEGRVEDTLSNSEGEFFTSDQVFDFFHGLNEVDNFQLIEKSKGTFDLLLIPSNGSGLDKEGIAQEFKRFFDASASVKAFTVNSIKAEDGGKFRFVKSRSFDSIAQ